ncbi:glycosyltransferase [Campylobacter sp. JMF_01 NE2]|uniref:glycosyltransferase family protein n=1 Tax=unclassified Campylobacter TaxID=2593542 RepID=UPI0022E9AFE1|nr:MULTISPECIES: glycosyltransferase [unclassified Campylobacter]MDA3052772.1 glycosyltransferase [Campylobacter sp. JMF_03 NE3]MDA3067103.1 glycosyltransferase [Campylobacter sp. JMF_01 NE2]
MRSLKIVHCSIFNEFNDGNFFYGVDRRVSHGLVRNGHFVYDFSYRDWERHLRFAKIKNTGLSKMNKKLIKICKNINADLLLIGKGEKIATSTLKEIKKALPNLKIALWYVDHLNEVSQFWENLREIDCFFHANAYHLQRLSSEFRDIKFAFFPNISDESFDIFYETEKSNDIIYISRDYMEDNRHKFAILLDEFCKKNGLKYEIYASLGNGFIFGDDYYRAIAKSKIAINFNRDDEIECENSKKLLGASNRMAHFMGCGVCTFSPVIAGFEKFFTHEKEIVYFKNPSDCFEKILEYLRTEKYAQIAKAGREKALNLANAKRVTQFMIETIFGEKFSENYEWREHIYQNGEKI